MSQSPKDSVAAHHPGLTPPPGCKLVRKLGEGGFGEVWEGVGPGGVPQAVKFIKLGSPAGEAEMRALEVMRTLRHAHLVSLFGAWQSKSHLVLAMELADETLFDRHRRGGIPHPELLEFFRQAALGIDFLNARDILHRDIKPHNLLLVGGSVKVADFGLARVLEQNVQNLSGKMTAAYAAPEFFDQQGTRWSDQYSLAITYCQMRGGRLPFGGSQMQMMAGHLSQPPDLSMLPEAERAAVSRALAKKPDQRWPTCVEFVQALSRATEMGDPEMIATEPAVPVLQTQTWLTGRSTATKSRRWRVIAGILVGALLVGIVGGIAFRRAKPSGTDPVADTGLSAEDRAKEREAADKLRRLGAKVSEDSAQPGSPVVGVEWTEQPMMRDIDLEWLLALPRLRELNLSGSKINDSNLAIVGRLRSLERLTLHRCDKLSPASARQLTGLKRLQYLDYSLTQIDATGTAELKHLPALMELHLTGCRGINDEAANHVSDCTKLEVLSLSATSVGNNGLAGFDALTRLRVLYLESVPVEDLGLFHLRKLSNLQTVSLGKTNVSGNGLEAIEGWSNLERLSLANCSRVDSRGLRCVKGLKKLTYLDLGATSVGDGVLVHLRELPDLRELYLFQCKGITNQAAAEILLMRKLERIALAGTSMDQKTQDSLRKTRPTLKFNREP